MRRRVDVSGWKEYSEGELGKIREREDSKICDEARTGELQLDFGRISLPGSGSATKNASKFEFAGPPAADTIDYNKYYADMSLVEEIDKVSVARSRIKG